MCARAQITSPSVDSISSKFSSGCFASWVTNASSRSNICVRCLYRSGDGAPPAPVLVSTGSSSNRSTDDGVTSAPASEAGELGRDRLRGGGLSARFDDAPAAIPAPDPDEPVPEPEPELEPRPRLEPGLEEFDADGRAGAARRCAERSERKTLAYSGSSWFTTEETQVWRKVSALIGEPSSHISRNLTGSVGQLRPERSSKSKTYCCCLISYRARRTISS